VGITVILGVVLLTYMTFTVGNFKWGRADGYRLISLFDSVAGLDIKSTVRVAGVEVGKVETVELSEGKARVTMRIRPEVKLKHGAKATVRAAGLLGEKYLEIIPGEAEGFLQDQDQIPQSIESADLDRLIQQFSSIAEDVKVVTSSLRGALGEREGEESLKEIVANIRDLSRNLSVTVKENREAFGKTVQNFQEFSSFIKEEAPKLVESLNRIVVRLEKGEGTLGKLLTDEGVYAKLDSTLENLNRITQKVEKGEGTIGKLFADDSAYENLNSTLEGFSNAVSRIERFKTTIGFRNEYQFAEQENKGYFSLKLQPRGDKFYLLEVADDPRGRTTKTTTDIVTNGVPSSTTTIESRRKLKFSAVFGKRFSDLGLRAGLIENTIGAGTDYHLLDDRLRFSLDVWDFNSDDPESQKPRLKTTVSYAFFKFLFVQGGVDNILNQRLSTPFGGAGITLEDDDLKYLLGSASLLAR
jgi:phospholipid/cholesterol/gamma-HCH transport system substrate-binding protein